MKSICVIVVWIGEFSEGFPLWLNSVKKNPTIDFYIITDQDFSQSVPRNVFFIRNSLSGIKAIFEKELGIKICLKKPYKLCDYKPVWWMLMDNRLQNYDYYGYCDMDMVFGDIRHFLTDEFLEQYDKIFDRGYFTLYRNNEEMRNLYKRSLDRDNCAYPFTKAFKTQYSCYFDEFMGMGILGWQYKKVYLDQLEEKMIQDPDWKRLEFGSYISSRAFVFHWENGRLFRINVDSCGEIIEPLSDSYKGEEILLAHIQKRNLNVEFDAWDKEKSKDFWIYPNSFADNKPEGKLYTDKDKTAYAEMIRESDKKKKWQNLKENGIIQYVPHFFRIRNIRKYTQLKKGYF